MAEDKKLKWQEEVETILREKYQGNELLEQLQRATELVNLANEVELPTEDIRAVVSLTLKLISEKLYPLAAVYAGFQLGVAYERRQNANRTRES